MPNKYTLGVDFGGSSSKATLLSDAGKVIATSTKEYPSYFPFPNWYEQNADELYEAFLYNARACLEKSCINPAEIVAISLDAATHMAVFCDKNGRPIRNFIHWSDSRSGKQVKYLRDNFSPILAEHTVNSVSPLWTLPQILWLNENEPHVLKQTKRIFFVKDYIRYLITGDFCTDFIEAMGSMLADDYRSLWCTELCEIAQVDINTLPPIRNPLDIAGYVNSTTAALTGLKEGTPVIVGSTDTVMEVYASGAISEGTATIKLATAGRICPVTSSYIPNPQLLNYRHIIPGKWYPGTGTRSCAASYKWYRDVFGQIEALTGEKLGTSAYEVLNRGAEQVPAGSEGLFFHPYLMGEMTPYYDDALCASFTGVKRNHTKGHFTRAVMEGVSFSMRDCLEEIKAQNIPIDQYRLIGGGAKGNLWCQILSDVLAMPLTCTLDNDSSLGSAMLAGVAAGMFNSFQESVDKCVVVSKHITPIEDNVTIYEKNYQQYRDIAGSLSEIYHKYG